VRKRVGEEDRGAQTMEKKREKENEWVAKKKAKEKKKRKNKSGLGEKKKVGCLTGKRRIRQNGCTPKGEQGVTKGRQKKKATGKKGAWHRYRARKANSRGG